MKKKSIGILLMYALAVVFFVACEEEVEPLISDPSVSIFFLNKDSLDQVNVIIDSLSEEQVKYDTVITNLETSADQLVDRLIVITDSIANGGDLDQEREQIIHDLDTLNLYLTGIEREDSVVNATKSGWNSTAATISSGFLKVTSIENTKKRRSIVYEESSSNWKLPLDMRANDVDLDIKIADRTYRLAVGYSRSTVTDEKNKVIIRTSDFEIISTTFNSASVTCGDCIDSQTTIYVEF
ncbi:hypothetical protein N7E81_11715 [Reichenbachiella carrageenanivorans]|uniref:Uncharacterized protein n=1 Tax=Reichenbachiella carrageenanivorans TaxID=2979869 RepID=A0ABY6CVU6_9BACT|nr:hypothetical protein [Reichenbachiella carrageenanivorans]UXX78025.1 hypothetical protein N7E81_11715 [Reichenbachiella carrageenanivorans]